MSRGHAEECNEMLDVRRQRYKIKLNIYINAQKGGGRLISVFYLSTLNKKKKNFFISSLASAGPRGIFEGAYGPTHTHIIRRSPAIQGKQQISWW